MSNDQLNPDTVIKVENLSKKFCRNLKRSIAYGFSDIMKNMVGVGSDNGKLRKDEFWALEDVSFELKKGEVLGIIGVNGSGKSTLLRILNGIYPPDKGKIEVRGKIGALIAVGAGFHPHMTGRENIYLNGTILGMSKDEIDRKLPEIIAFADIGDFLEAPVSTYSSGMNVRLGFSIAIHCDPDILLIDEILSVGDLSFRNKSLRKMSEFRNKANGIISISHNLEQVRMLCDRVIILDKGKLLYEGPTHEGCIKYEKISQELEFNNLKITGAVDFDKMEFRNRQSSENEIEFLDLKIRNEKGSMIEKIGMYESMKIVCRFKLKKEIEGLCFTAGVVSSDDYSGLIHLISNDFKKLKTSTLMPGEYNVSVFIPKHHLVPNLYLLNFAIRNDVTGETYERIFSKVAFLVETDGKHLNRGVIGVEEIWKLDKV